MTFVEIDETGLDAKACKVAKKEGGKKGAELAGASDMGGIEFFTTYCESANGDSKLLDLVIQEMNRPIEEGMEEVKGGSGHVGKLVFSAGEEALGAVAYVPEEKKDKVNAITWLEKVLESFGN